MTIRGGCRCGAVRYELTDAPDRVSICHCRDCQKSAGAPMVVWAMMPAGRFRLTKGAPNVFNSSGDSYRYFCSACGTGLYYVNETFLPGLIDVQATTLDEADAYPPGAQVQTAEQAAWISQMHTIEAFPRYPGMA